MAGELRHYVNSTLVDEPSGWRDFKEEIERDFDKRLISNKFPLELTFIGSGHELLRNLYLDSFCDSVPYSCEQYCDGDWVEVAVGTIIIADIEWQLNRCEAKVSVADDGAGARILNNKDIAIFPTADKTKNGEAIDPVTPIDLEVFDPQAALGTYLAQTRTAYDWFDCMNHLVLSITDNLVSVTSDWYAALPTDERYCVLRGFELRAPSTNPQNNPSFNFTDLFESLALPYDLWASVEREDDGTMTLRIEPQSYFYGDTYVVSYPNTDELVQSIETKLLFEMVQFGSQGAIKNEAASPQYSLPYIILRTFAEEKFHLQGTCNTDSILDLTNPFATDTNAIEDSCISGSTDNDSEVFLIQYDSYSSQAVKGDYLFEAGVGPYLYNEQLLNGSILARYNLPAAGVSYYAGPDAEFQATEAVPGSIQTITGWGSNGTAVLQQQFSNDYSPPNFDTGNNYGNGTIPGTPVSLADSRYTAPSQGYYQFEADILWSLLTNTTDAPVGQGNDCRHRVYFNLIAKRFNSSNVLLQTVQKYTAPDLGPEHLTPALYQETLDFSMPMQVNDYVEVFYQIKTTTPGICPVFNNLTSLPTDYTTEARVIIGLFKTNFVATGRGIISEANPDTYYCVKLEFPRHIDLQTWLDLKADIRQQVLVSENDNMRIGYVR